MVMKWESATKTPYRLCQLSVLFKHLTVTLLQYLILGYCGITPMSVLFVMLIRIACGKLLPYRSRGGISVSREVESRVFVIAYPTVDIARERGILSVPPIYRELPGVPAQFLWPS